MVIGHVDASDVEGYDRRTPELYDAPLHMEKEVNSVENFRF